MPLEEVIVGNGRVADEKSYRLGVWFRLESFGGEGARRPELRIECKNGKKQ